MAIYDGKLLWASVLLGFENGLLKLVTSLPSRAVGDSILEWKLDRERLVEIAADLFSPIGFGFMCQRSVVDRLGIGPENWLDWIGPATRGELLCLPEEATFMQIVDELRKVLAGPI